jgi:hypothetical protein
MPLDDRLAFLRELRHAYGRTGIVLSGGNGSICLAGLHAVTGWLACRKLQSLGIALMYCPLWPTRVCMH